MPRATDTSQLLPLLLLLHPPRASDLFFLASPLHRHCRASCQLCFSFAPLFFLALSCLPRLYAHTHTHLALHAVTFLVKFRFVSHLFLAHRFLPLPNENKVVFNLPSKSRRRMSKRVFPLAPGRARDDWDHVRESRHGSPSHSLRRSACPPISRIVDSSDFFSRLSTFGISI